MQKLQELITKHKEKLREGKYNTIELDMQETGTCFLDCRHTFTVAYSLSDLLFNTPFLSLLEWKRNITFTEMRVKTIYEDTNIESDLYYENNHNFHKINLALLESDKERVDYISNFTL